MMESLTSKDCKNMADDFVMTWIGSHPKDWQGMAERYAQATSNKTLGKYIVKAINRNLKAMGEEYA